MSSVVLLGAGLGARLRPHTDDRPKCVVEVAGEPLAGRLLRQLAERGVTKATVVVGHFAERAKALISAYLRSRAARLDLRFVENREYDRSNTMYSLLLAMDALADGGFVVEGDIIASEAAVDALTAVASGARALRSYWAVEAWTAEHSGS
ncbi:MAG: NTP transferase domain-containing protein [Myxococcales bacterium]|nr:NTP transferase domain-containing protein [Myxococcales bacterium]